MRLHITLFLAFLLNYPNILSGNPIGLEKGKKQLVAVRTTEAPKIDGILDDEVWNLAPVANDFIQYSPYSGNNAAFPTEVRVLYDNEALYISALMFDPRPDSIFVQLGQRDSDNSINADFFSFEISTFNDGLNGETFKVSASGVQTDRKARSAGAGGGGSGGGMGGRDSSWDAVWFSKVQITEEGWVVEMKIPYSALRFPKTDIQTWGINFFREIRRKREMSSWSYVDREVGTTINHLGELVGLKDLIPPVRLSLTPYVSGYAEKYDDNKIGYSYSGGLDLKYGINESFTLDATLVPDFGQVQSDDQVLNLTPYEVKYNEKRPFFMEGIELFSRGDIFYSRRIGAKPRMYYDAEDSVGDDEEMIFNPSESSLINASKFSGRTKSGLGIGLFNAMTKSMYAEIQDTITGEIREYKTEPFTNFNMLVLDQSLRNNSYFSIENTNVWRDATKDSKYYTANVTATDFRFQDKTRFYSFAGKVAVSQKYYSNDPSLLGHSFQFNGGKTGGAFRLEYRLTAISETYDPNDMGYLRRNNEFQNGISASYNTFKPFWKIYTTRNSVGFNYNQLYDPRVFTSMSINMNSFTTFRNSWSFNVRIESNPVGEDNYEEPRIYGRFYHIPKDIDVNFFLDTDRSKKYSVNIRSSATKRWSEYDQKSFSLALSQDLNISTRLTTRLNLDYSLKKNDIGYVSYRSLTEEIVFGKRDNTTFTTTLESDYIFTADSYLTFRLRHYWSRADYDGTYYNLTEDGGLEPGYYTGNPDYNYNAFNIDMVYTWRFAPGSELTFVWKNAIYSGSSTIIYDFMDNMRYMFDSPMLNSLSFKLLYYLDYQSLKKRK